MMTDSGPFWKRKGINCSQKQNPRFLKHENQTGIAQNYIRELKNQVEFQDMDISRALEGCAHSRRQKDLLHEELAAPKRVLRDTQIRGIHDLEALRRVQELRIDEFSKKGK